MEVENQATSPAFDDFLQTGRTGRRNAMPDIRGENAAISTASLPDSLEKLTCSDLDSNCTPGTSGSSQPPPASVSNT
ncbi:hypothetical protein JTE90_001354 [Oedothorax gibbosus]|uniref:cAMP-dependent protein kinase inhibitor n=1 Tax=Oedothorax gibbosus TaxID=931172 RepID=A0AAV6VF57_9ARAC|nr:hypothetical protein JTE90_001354 [Oedothorax gibbosus]